MPYTTGIFVSMQTVSVLYVLLSRALKKLKFKYYKEEVQFSLELEVR